MLVVGSLKKFFEGLYPLFRVEVLSIKYSNHSDISSKRMAGRTDFFVLEARLA